MPLDDDTLSKLLKMKRYEQPPPEYFNQFLRDFQERQRAEMLRRPVWRLALDRLTARLEGLIPARPEWAELTLSQLSYAGASTCVLLIAGVFTLNMLQHPGGQQPPTYAAISANSASSTMENTFAAAQAQGQAAVSMEDRLTLNAQYRLPEVSLNDGIRSVAVPQHQPRYILDTRPASYEPPFSF